MNAPENHYLIKARHVKFDFAKTPIQWIEGDPESTHIINTLNLLFPEGELWFCRVYNKALPLITDAALRADADGFLRQEAVHSRSHGGVLKHYYERHGIDTKPFTQRINWLFTKVLGEKPLGLKIGHTRFWLRQQLAVIASLEHFFGYLGNWVLHARGLDDGRADPTVVDLLRWHGAEEVEHRTVAFDIYRHLGGNYVERSIHMTIVIMILLYFIMSGAKYMYERDPGTGRYPGFVLSWWRGSRRNHLPSFWKTIGAALRYYRPSYTPHAEGSTEFALEYLARSPAAQAASHGGNWVAQKPAS
ncbi:metal-dependent hydrolase [Burkholderia thailandensis]|uniref:Metal-dependent hydrolase family protein n=1 Tax=Burkholderia thailandensis TaxID=57975 RepID=A0AAW9CWD2_BURTH|nr:metal-dependent hydrolase [Burkholderia thailandensis]AHI67171.1 putative metal-dependent hydrolase family protein [Burkholderia thailandensis H0587]AOJ55008.1 metal-dependent hydrolase [Burkholderia thailandensis]AVR29437.1 metal-dependent hydrolase [Burkholderia thailandensis]MCS3393340.1 metal-dependent hydrolase [Burkholderia thailandensis]MCS6426600.1 metal-dependent hydrolase [Burkholderia thailandensis]